MSQILSVLVLLLIITIIITVHEWGHFVTAKKFGVYCKEFAIGMGKKIFSRQKGETEFTIRMIPMGGFVQMIGEDGEVDETLTPGDTVWIRLNTEGKIKTIAQKEMDASQEVEIISFSHDVQPMVLTYAYEDTIIENECENLVTYIYADNQEDDVVAKDRQFTNLKPWKKIIVLAAGATMNFILGFLCILTATWIGGVNVEPIILQDGLATEQVNAFEVDDKIVAIDGVPMDLTEVTSFVQGNAGKTVEVTVERNGKTVDLKREIQTQQKVELTKDGETEVTYGVLGVRYKPNHTNVFAIFGKSIHNFIEFFQSVFLTLISLFTGKVSFTQLTGIVGIAQQTNMMIAAPTVATSGFAVFGEVFTRMLTFTAFLSINIGIFNLLPLPALDGGRIVFAVYELIFRRKASKKLEMYINAAGFLLLIGLFVMVTFMDIGRLFS